MILPDKKAFFLAMREEFRRHIGQGRFNDPVYITRVLAVSSLPYVINGVVTAFCDPFLTFLACKVLAVANHEILTDANAVRILKSYRAAVDEHYFKTESSCTLTQQAAAARGQWLDSADCGENTDILPAWFIVYDFGNGDRHIGMVDVDGGDTLTTLEANTTAKGHSGMIAQKQRNWNCIWGYVRTYE